MANANHIKWSDIGGVYVGTAYIFGDQTGNARGAGALDLQSSRNSAAETASGAYSLAVGSGNTVSGDLAAGFGINNTCSGQYSFAFGFACTASAQYSVAIGYSCSASGTNFVTSFGINCSASANYSGAIGIGSSASGANSFAAGINALSRIGKTTNICGPQICRKDDGESAGTNFESFCGAQVILRTKEVDLKSAATHTITLPSGCHFFPDECGVNVTSLNTLTIQPSISFGITGSNAALKAAAITTLLTAQFSRERMQTLLTAAGQTTLTATITVGATATTLLGCFYFKGILIEDE